MKHTRSTCPYCGVGCGVVIEHDERQIHGVRGDPEHPANFGRLCTKGSTLALTAAAPVTLQRRLQQPLLHGRPVGWDEALDTAADRLAAIAAAHGPDAIGFYVSGQLLTEDYHAFNKLVKGVLGTNHIDTNSRLCMSSAVAGYKLTLGADAPPCSYEDLDHAGTVFIAGSNMAWAHPILFRRLEDAKRQRPRMRIVVADPRRTETAEFADLHLPLAPGSDVALFHGLLHVMAAEGRLDAAFIDRHTRGFDALHARVQGFDPATTARLTGLREADIVQAARWFADGPALSLYCQGLNQSIAGTDKNAALINLHLATGWIGKPGAGPFSLTGQPNAMGGREAGGMATLLPGHRDPARAEDRAEVARLWGVPALPAAPGRTAVEMFEAAADGAVKALWIACTNPAQSLPDQATVRRALQRAEFVVVQEAFAGTATAAFAHLLLPASSWGEKDGTVTNSERRISRVRAAVPPPGQARHDWAIAADLGRRLEARLHPGRPTLFPWHGPEAVWHEHRAATAGRDLDITGLSYALLDRIGPQQWPMPEGAAAGRARLYEDGRFATPDGRARFHDCAFTPTAEATDGGHPLALLTGRLRDQWHGMSRTGTLGRLFGHAPEPVVELAPATLQALGTEDGALVRVQSRRGALVLAARASDAVAPGQAFVAMHWGPEFTGGREAEGGVNALTTPAFCSRSKQPELKHAAVRVEPVALPWRLLAMGWDASARDALRALMPGFDHASVLPFGQAREGVLLRAACAVPPAPAMLAAVEAALGLAPDDATLLRYADTARGRRRTLRLVREGDAARLEAFVVAGDGQAEPWLRELMATGQPVQQLTRQLLVAAGPSVPPPRRRQVCNCFDVDEASIAATLAGCSGSAEQRLAQLQQARRCGTQCGSCLPALRRLVQAAVAVPQTA